MLKAKPDKLYVNGFGEFIGREEGCLVVRKKGKTEKRFPLFDNQLKEIQIRSGNGISSGALVTCGYWGIDLIVLSGRGSPVAVLKSLYDDSHVKTRLCQYEAYNSPKGMAIAKQFVISKLEGQNQVLKKYGLKRIDFSVIEAVKNADADDFQKLRRRIMGLEGKCSERYFDQIFSLFQESIRPSCRKKFKAFDGVNNLFNLAYRILTSKVHVALIKAKLEPFLGFLHGIQFGKPSLVCDFIELYRYQVDNFLIDYARNLTPRDFVVKSEDYSKRRKGKRQYLTEELTNKLIKKLNAYFEKRVEIPRIKVGKRQKLETLIDEEALLLAKYLRDERKSWVPRIAKL